MAATILLLYTISVLLLSVNCDLYLEEGARCGERGVCVEIYKCPTAATTYIYRNGGYTSKKYNFPELPEICSYKNNSIIVCCTDCNTGDETLRYNVVAPNGATIKKNGKPAHDNCADFFHNFPYPCRGQGNVHFEKVWNADKKCHELKMSVALPVGGRDAQRWEFPHMALLGYGSDVETVQWLCGGSIISERFILTAAHCSSSSSVGPIKYAALGLLKRTDPKEFWKIYNIKRIIVHPQYKAPVKYHDIALLETETEINFGRDVLPACLDFGKYRKNDAEAAGWGRKGHRQDLVDNLHVVYLNEFNEKDCSDMYQPHRHLKQGYSHETQMCYGSKREVIDTCEGDSGGPLQTNQLKCLYTVVGVTSYGKDCGILGNAGIYTRVSHYVPWIESIVWPNYNLFTN